MLGALSENGPYNLNADSLELEVNEYGWNAKSNLLYVDQPLGTGFSAGGKCSNEGQIGQDFLEFVRGFLETRPALWAYKHIYLSGESYAGHYVPHIATALKKAEGNIGQVFKGVMIGNGWYDPLTQYPSFTTWLNDKNLLSGDAKQKLDKQLPKCLKLLEKEHYKTASAVCSAWKQLVRKTSSNEGHDWNMYDVRIPCEVKPLCYDQQYLEDWLRKPDVMEALGVHDDAKWKDCDWKVAVPLLADTSMSARPQIEYLLSKNVKVSIYAGTEDWQCNEYGSVDVLNALEWIGQDEWADVAQEDWIVDGEIAGTKKEFRNLSFIRIYEAGHMVPMDQPRAAEALYDELF